MEYASGTKNNMVSAGTTICQVMVAERHHQSAHWAQENFVLC